MCELLSDKQRGVRNGERVAAVPGLLAAERDALEPGVQRDELRLGRGGRLHDRRRVRDELPELRGRVLHAELRDSNRPVPLLHEPDRRAEREIRARIPVLPVLSELGAVHI